MIETLRLIGLHAIQLVFGFTYYYPLFMAYLWSIGALWFFLRYEFRQPKIAQLTDHPKVSIVVPCFNEEDHVREVIGHLMDMHYPDYEVIAVNDGSTDNTGKILDELASRHPRLRVIHQAKNQGKSIGLTTAAYLADSEYIIGIDGDALLDHDAISWFLHHFLSGEQVGAVTGNPRIRTRSTLLGRLQVGEFSSLVGLIKRAQRVFYRQLFTASGVITAFRRSALEDVNYWSQDMLTEDMDITWKLQLRGWDVRFEPRALAWILMPETMKGLWNQRLRWAMGGLQIINKYKGIFLDWRTYPVWPLFFEHILSVFWALSVTAVLAGYLFDLLEIAFHGMSYGMSHGAVSSMTSLLPEYSGVIIGTTCLLQMLLSLLMDCRYDHQLLRYYVWTIWYPFGFWIVNMLTIIVAIPKILFRKRGLRARWVSPDRGISL
ncbi:poly-beta-1,6-N-acetyl-D-glucosamine synthase [Methyloglobulus sp.]|uniref:poly-beta-1,6-N-acetyl-D-glucosamine synthase n=1 Tax=Methyloglobulus sp. TaxID=2518622 RepID=UPI0032B738AD